jgi:hypothetical protein
MMRKGWNQENAKKKFGSVSTAFPDASPTSYVNLIPRVNFPVEKDRHIWDVPLYSTCTVTNTWEEFPKGILDNFELVVIPADDFLVDIIDLNHEQAISPQELHSINTSGSTSSSPKLILSVFFYCLKDRKPSNRYDSFSIVYIMCQIIYLAIPLIGLKYWAYYI